MGLATATAVGLSAAKFASEAGKKDNVPVLERPSLGAKVIQKQIVKPLAKGQISNKNAEKIKELRGDFQKDTSALLLQVQERFPQYEWRITTGYRSPEEQTRLFKKGITRAKAGQSYHQQRLAIDIYPLLNGKIPTYEQANEAYDYLGQVASGLSLTWGAKYRGDYGHVEKR